MKILSYKTHSYFLVTAIIILVAGLILLALDSEATFDINVHDTYFVIARFHGMVLLTLLYIIMGSIYWLFRNFRFSKRLTKIHTAITIGSIPAYWIIVPLLALGDTLFTNRAETAGMTILLLAILVQPLLIINLVIGLSRGRDKHTDIA
jgi:heme/copper-type cytochrome/quinol oxidase subunit 1